MQSAHQKAKYFILSEYIKKALTKVQYERDKNGIVIAKVPGASGFLLKGIVLRRHGQTYKM